MKKLKRFNEILHSEEPHQITDNQFQQGVFQESDIVKFKEFSENRLGGATKIASNAEEKGGDALLTYHHFQVKLPYYRQASEGQFNPKTAESHYGDLIDELVELTGNGMNIEQIHFQELMGKIEVVGELLIKYKDL